MKTSPNKIILIGLSLATAFAGFGEGALGQQQPPKKKTLGDYYNEGIALYQAGNYAEAKKYFDFVVSKNPKSPHARAYLAKTNLALKQNLKPKFDLEGKLAKVIVPAVDFSEASLGDVMDYLSKRAEELTDGKVVANFIYKGTAAQRSGSFVTLKLRDVPMNEVIRYVGNLTNTRFDYEEHAIVGTPANQAAAPATQPAKAETGAENNGFEKPKGGVTPLPNSGPAPNPFKR